MQRGRRGPQWGQRGWGRQRGPGSTEPREGEMSHPGWTGAHVCKKTVVCVLSCICVCTHVLGTRVVRSERAPGCAGVGCTDADSPGHVLRPPVGWMRAVCREEPLGPFARSADTRGTEALSFLLWGFPFSGLRAAPALPRVLLASKEELGGGCDLQTWVSALLWGWGLLSQRPLLPSHPLLSWPCQDSEVGEACGVGCPAPAPVAPSCCLLHAQGTPMVQSSGKARTGLRPCVEMLHQQKAETRLP
uniref:Uncharacterized protein n=1 Tax=Mandrillus leucophaeus TaxID=9568 RepID=A0A2K6A3U9_MANLE